MKRYEIFYWQILLFPVAVVLAASISFFCGIPCSAWQWWSMVGLALGGAWLFGDWKEALIANTLFILLLALMYLAFSFYTDEHLCSDYPNYQAPAIRLLAEGWNPVRDSDMTAVLAQLKLNPWDMRYYHIMFGERAMWVFNAVAYKFLRQPYAVTFALNWFMELMFLLVTLRFFRSMNWHWVFAVICAAVMCFECGGPADSPVCLAGGALMMTMALSLKDRNVRWLELAVFSFWMMNVKTPGLLSCFIFWVIFAVATLARGKGRRFVLASRFTAMAAVLSATLLLVNFSPLVTSYVRYGHPLYPFMTADEEKYPVQDITWHFRYRNADGEMLGHFGNIINSYVSPALTRVYYNYKLKRKDFAPHCRGWDEGMKQLAPTAFRERFIIWLALLAMAFVPEMRIIALMMIVGAIAVPSQYIGYCRYTPWIWACEALALCALASVLLAARRRALCVFAAVSAFYIFYRTARTAIGEICYFGETEELTGDVDGELYAVTAETAGEAWVAETATVVFTEVEDRPYILRSGKNGYSPVNNIKLLFYQLGQKVPVVLPYRREFDVNTLVNYHGNYYRRSEDKHVNPSYLSLGQRLKFVIREMLPGYLRFSISMIAR